MIDMKKNIVKLFLFVVVFAFSVNTLAQNSYSGNNRDLSDKYIGAITDNARYIAEQGDVIKALSLLLELDANPQYSGNKEIEAAMRYIRDIYNSSKYKPIHEIGSYFFADNAISNGGKYLYISANKRILVYDVENSSYKQLIEFDDDVLGLTLTDDEKSLLVNFSNGKRSSLIDIEEGKIVKTFEASRISKHINDGHYYTICDACISKNQKHIATLDGKHIGIWSTQSGDLLHVVNIPFANDANSMTISNDGSRLIVNDYNKEIIINCDSGEIIETIELEYRISATLFNNDASKVMIAGNDIIKTYDTATGKEIKCISDCGLVNYAYCLDNEAEEVVTIGDNINSISNVWYPYTSFISKSGEISLWALYNKFSPDGKSILISSMDPPCMQIWQNNGTRSVMKESVAMNEAGNMFGQLVYSNSGDLLLTLDNPQITKLSFAYPCGEGDYMIEQPLIKCKNATIYDGNTLDKLAALNGHEHKITSATFSPNDKYIATASLDKTIRVWRTDDYKCLTVIRYNNGTINDVKIKNDGSIVATSSDNSILMWNINGDLLNTITLDTAATQLAISPNGKHLYTAEQGKIVIRDSQTGNFIHDALNSSMFSKIKFSRNGRWVVTINSQYPKQVAEPHKQIVKIWDMTTEELINTINCDTYDGYFSTEISEDGKTLIVTCAEIFDNNIKTKVYDIESGVLLNEKRNLVAYFPSCAISPNNENVIIGDTIISIWDYGTRSSIINDCRKIVGNYKLSPSDRKKYNLD